MALAPPQHAAAEATTLPRALGATAARRGDAIAVRGAETGEELTFAQLLAQAGDLAAGFAGLGVRRGDRVALRLAARPAAVVAETALACLGAAACRLPAASPEADAALRAAGAHLLVTERRELELVGRLATRLDHVVVVDEPRALAALRGAGPRGFDLAAAARAVRPDDALEVEAGGAARTHRDVLRRWAVVGRADGRAVAGGPGGHLPALLLGATTTTVADPAAAAAVAVTVRPTCWAATPPEADALRAAVEAAVEEAADARGRAAARAALATGVERAGLEAAGLPVPPGLKARHAGAEALVLRPLRERLGLAELDALLLEPGAPGAGAWLRGVGLPAHVAA